MLPPCSPWLALGKPELDEFHCRGGESCQRELAMGRLFANLPAACVLIFAAPALAGEIDVRSAIDSVTVYPDGATVTRMISVDLPQGDTTLFARDFPPGLDASSLRVEGETAAPVVTGAIDARSPRPERPPTAPAF